MELSQYVAVVIFALAGLSFPVINVLLGKLLRRDYPDPFKVTTYESGELPFGDARVKFQIHYYIFALMFVLFDILTVYLYPWAVVFRSIDRTVAFLEMGAFILVIGIGLLYAYKKKVLTWI